MAQGTRIGAVGGGSDRSKAEPAREDPARAIASGDPSVDLSLRPACHLDLSPEVGSPDTPRPETPARVIRASGWDRVTGLASGVMMKRQFDAFLTAEHAARGKNLGFATGVVEDKPLDLCGVAGDERALLAQFNHAAGTFWWNLTRASERDGYVRHQLVFPAPVEDAGVASRHVTGSYWEPAGVSVPGPAVIMLHGILGSDIEALDFLASRLARRGVRVLRLDLAHHGERQNPAGQPGFWDAARHPEELAAFLRRSVMEVRRAASWLEGRAEVDPKRLGLVGNSLGGIVGSLVLGVDPRFRRAALTMTGADLPAILYNDALGWRDLLATGGHTRDQVAHQLRGVEPLTLAPRARAVDLIMINGEDDEVIPRASATALQQAIGADRIEWLPGGHDAVFRFPARVIERMFAHFGDSKAAGTK